MIQIENYLSGKPLSVRQQQLLVKNLPFAEKTARSYAEQANMEGVDMNELISESTMGLTIAASRFHPRCGAEFTTYAFSWCIKAIMARFNDIDPDAIPVNADLDDDEDETLGLAFDSEEEERAAEQSEKVATLLTALNRQERKVITLLFGLENDKPMSEKAVAKKLKLMPERIRMVRDKALGKMRYAALNEE